MPIRFVRKLRSGQSRLAPQGAAAADLRQRAALPSERCGSIHKNPLRERLRRSALSASTHAPPGLICAVTLLVVGKIAGIEDDLVLAALRALLA